ncbi:hypothetical protein LJ656_07300 [Paraburkholderia sp. MMS20-SJTR3]|uniref:Uncharacterized protein n=1 Tax=Paraburkholderia sejongensis TaxID=2886946 RepID=A0ABS8JR67_9BURK|nr:hypothetical protein [Paraburkholderia sp. MMS20-SJTR3]MCC8392391.1 hypothetical protein [Paraburkholderia sp. MMS20-SJTR3]
MKRAFAALLLSLPALCLAELKPKTFPPCDNWPTRLAEGQLKRNGILGNIDDSRTRAVLVSNEKIGKYEDGQQMWRQVYHITFHDKSGRVIDVMTVSDAGEFECSLTGADVFVVTQHYPSEEHLIKGLDYSGKKR